MTAHNASLINALVLIVFSGWAYISSGMASLTALLPAAFGIGLLACYSGVKAQNKAIAHIAVLLTLVILIALIAPLTGAIGRGDSVAIIRLLIMIATTVVALIYFVKSFIDARKQRA